MPTISDMKLYLIKQYPDSMFWHQKVQKMPTKQVVAIYKKMITRKTPITYEDGYHQIDMFEYMATLTQNHTEVKV